MNMEVNLAKISALYEETKLESLRLLNEIITFVSRMNQIPEQNRVVDFLQEMYNFLSTTQSVPELQLNQTIQLLGALLENIDRLNLTITETESENLDNLSVALRRLLRYNQQMKKSSAEEIAPPPPPADTYMMISKSLAQTLTFIDGLMKSLLSGKVIDDYLFRLYDSLQRDILSMKEMQVKTYKKIMQELQRSMERVLFGSSRNTQSQLDLITLWTQLLYLYNQMALIAKVAKGGFVPPPPPEEGVEALPSPPPPAAPSPPPPSPPPPSSEGGTSPRIVRTKRSTQVSPREEVLNVIKTGKVELTPTPEQGPKVIPEREDTRGASPTALQEAGKRLKKTGGPSARPKYEEDAASSLFAVDPNALAKFKARAAAMQGEEEDDESEWDMETQITFKTARIYARLKAAIPQHMDSQLIGHPLFNNLPSSLILQLRLPSK